MASEDATKRITQDLHRTQPGFLDDSQIQSLQSVLLAYAAWNPHVGYCQGMNFVAAVFIKLGFCKADAFAGLSYLLEEVCPGCHGPDLGGFHRDSEVVDRLLRQFLPSTHGELAHAGVQVDLLAIDHFISLASRAWPLDAIVQLWDIILLEGPRAIFASFLALVELFMPLAQGSTHEDMQAFEIMELFKRESLRGVAGQKSTVFACVRKYVNLIPENLIEELRSDVVNVK
jgi:hypothetical protein